MTVIMSILMSRAPMTARNTDDSNTKQRFFTEGHLVFSFFFPSPFLKAP